jgi:nucleoside-diphosphate kinase
MGAFNCLNGPNNPMKGKPNMERTLSIVKPDGVAKGVIGEVVKRLEANALKVIAMKMIHMTKSQAEGFYAVHRERPFFGSLTDFMSSGPAVVMVLEGDDAISRYRELMGATNFKEAAEGTIRHDFATDIEKTWSMDPTLRKPQLLKSAIFSMPLKSTPDDRRCHPRQHHHRPAAAPVSREYRVRGTGHVQHGVYPPDRGGPGGLGRAADPAAGDPHGRVRR